jgi:hypothetical protein
VKHQKQGDNEPRGIVTATASRRRKLSVNRFGDLESAQKFAAKGEPGVRGDGIRRRFELEREHGLISHWFNLVG